MRKHSKEFTEPIFTLLDRYRAELLDHPLLAAARDRALATTTLHEFAYHQYSDSVTWIPMLAQMKSKATRSRRLQTAIADNIAHEAGLEGTSHVTLAVQLLRSLGITSIDGFPAEAITGAASIWLSDEFADFDEPGVVGWLLTAETLVPLMFAAVKPCFDALGDTRYFSEHIAVDADEHAQWMRESVDEHEHPERVRVEVPARIDNAVAARLAIAATHAFEALGVSGYGRADFRVTRGGEIVFIEMNPLPSLDPDAIDLYGAAAHVGIAPSALFGYILAAVERPAERVRVSASP
jgi:hypothetical protein